MQFGAFLPAWLAVAKWYGFGRKLQKNMAASAAAAKEIMKARKWASHAH